MTNSVPPHSIAVANAPVSYGAFEVTVGKDPYVPDGINVLDSVASAGYAGIDLGPVGFLGSVDQLPERLASRGLGLAGGYLEFPFTDRFALGQLLPELEAMLDIFDAVASGTGGPRPRPTIADAGSEERRAHPGWGVRKPETGYDAHHWRKFSEGLTRVVELCRERDYEPTFHHETGTFVESPAEIARVLEISDVGLCLDTGHLLIGGGDPVEAITSWGSRINQVHLKDATLSAFAEIVQDGGSTTDIWVREVFPALGRGDVDIPGVVSELTAIGYQGWIVVEQDILPRSSARLHRAAADQRANRAYLHEQGV